MASAADSNVPEFLERFPAPVVRYDSAEGRRVVRWANVPAEDLFGSRANEGRPLADVLSIFDVKPDGGTVVEPGERVVVTSQADGPLRTFLLRPVNTDADTPGRSGWLVFTDLSQYVDVIGGGRGNVGVDVGDGKEEPPSPTVEQFVSVLSHDLRNPLEVAELRLEAARETGEDVHFEKVEQALARIEGLLRDVRTVARGSTVVESTAPVALDALATDAWSTVRTAQATLEIDTEAMIEADEGQLRQLLENAFRNSVEHAGPDVSVRIGLLADDAGFYVADDGSGISPDLRDAVFEPGVSSQDGGTGLGLTITVRVADAHGWDVSIATPDDGGTRLEFAGVTVLD